MPDALQRLARDRPSETALSAGNRSWTYRDLSADIDQVAAGFTALGIAPGDRIVLHFGNVPELVIAYHACFRTGAIAAPMKPALKQAELEQLLARLRPALYLGDASGYASARGVAAEILPLDRRILTGGRVGNETGRHWDDLFHAAPPAAGAAEPDLDAPAVLLATSGTTGTPKFVAHSQRTLAETGRRQAGVGMRAGQAVLATTPLVVASGLFWMMGCMCLGTELILIDQSDAGLMLDLIESRHVAAMKGPPVMWSGLLDSQQARPRDVSSLQDCSAAGDVCPEALQRHFAEIFGTALETTWSSTECGGAFATGSCDRPMRPAEGTEIRIVGADGQPVAPGEMGELLVASPTLAIGYWNAPGELAPLGPDGWFRTGDMMRQEDGGGLLFMSRQKELVARGTAKISPAEVERVLAQHPAVLDAVVVGTPDPILGERVAALVKLRHGAADDVLGGILELARSRLAGYKVPERLVAADAIPRLPSGKIDRRRAAAMATAGVLDGA